MDDMMEKIQEVLSDPESMSQIQQLAQMFGMGGNQSAPAAAAPTPQPQPQQQSGNGLDVSSLLSMLQNQTQSQPAQTAAPAPSPAPSTGGVDLSGVMSMLQGVMGNQSAPAQNPSANAGGLGGFDMGSIMKLGQLMQSAQVNDKDTALLMAIKPHLSEERQPRVDKALKILKLISLFTAAKNSGLLSNLTL